jgi:putative component of membrane protein insertase Oxa1/YidC/SpoIIIJ protein YidD
MRTWRIPGALPGILFFFGLAANAATTELAADLFAEGDWVACRRECERALAQAPDDEAAELLGAVCRIRLTNQIDQGCTDLGTLTTFATSVNVRAMAAYELGRCCWARGDSSNAFRLFRQSFLEASSQDLFLRAGCSLDLLALEFPSLGKNDPILFQSLETSRSLWTPELVRECLPDKKERSGMLSKPGGWVVAFYREMVRPAIGGRCSLEPSCSEYFKQASEKHGLLGLPIQADRFIREPSVVQAQEYPVRVNGSTRYADPLSDHDCWMKK